MTSFTITVPGEYQTRSGAQAVVLEILDCLAFGRVLNEEHWYARRWHTNGRVSEHIRYTSETDIVAPWTEPRPPWEGWVDISNRETNTLRRAYVREIESPYQPLSRTTPALRVRQIYPPA